MMNVTTRLAVRIRHYPDWDVNWLDIEPQKNHTSLQLSDFLPSEGDAEALKLRAVHYMMWFLTQEFEALADMNQFTPKHGSPHPPTKSQVVPLFKDEKYTSDTIDILAKLMEDGNL